MTPVTGELLSASSLLAALLGLLYGTWYAEITAAATIRIPDHDAASLIRTTGETLRTRAVPLVVVAAVLTAALAPPALAVVWHTVEHLFGLRHGRTYDAVKACFVAVFCVVAFLLVTVLGATRRIQAQLARLRAVPD